MATSDAVREQRRPVRDKGPDGSFRRKALSLALFLILVASVLNALFGDRGLLELLRARRELVALEAEIESLEEDKRRFLAEIPDLKSSPLAVERLAREELNLIKPNEILLLIRRPQEETPLPSRPPSSPSARR